MAVSLDTIRANVYTVVYDHLQTGTYAISTDNIHPSYNDQQLRSEGYPQVIIHHIKSPEDKITFGANGMYHSFISFMIEVHHSSAGNVRTLADEIASKFRGDGKESLATNGLKRVKLDDEDDDKIPWTQTKSSHIIRLSYTARYIGAS